MTQRDERQKFEALDRYNTVRTWSDGSVTKENWQAIVEFCDGLCLRCGGSPVTKDHVVPVAQGGGHTIYNLQPLCQPCNSWKHDRHIDYRKEGFPFT